MRRFAFLLALVAVAAMSATAYPCDEKKGCSSQLTKTENKQASEKEGCCGLLKALTKITGGCDAKLTATTKKEDCAKSSCGATLTTKKEGCSSKGATALTTTKQDCSTKSSCGATVTTKKESCSSKGATALTTTKQDCSTKSSCGAALTTQKESCSSKGAALTTQKESCSSKGAALTAAQKETSCSATLTKPAEGCSSKATTAVLTTNSAFPKMVFKVGSKSTCCPQEASQLVSTGSKMQYVVGDKTYDDYVAAMTQLVNDAEATVASFSAVNTKSCEGKVCPLTGKKMAGASTFAVAGGDFGCSKKAAGAAELAKTAMAKMSMKYRVGDEVFCCDKMAGDAAQKTSAKMAFVVGGETTHCPLDARYKLAHAKFLAAEKAVKEASL